MRPKPTRKPRLDVLSLEDRCNPNTGIPWLDSSSLTLSFAPDGTDISGKPSELTSLMSGMSTAAWQKEVLRGFQTWAAQANVNFGLTADGGQAFGTAGAPQEDTRFGDVRIGARKLSNDLKDSVAGSSGFSDAGGTWAGDMLLNSKFKFGVGVTSNQYDLFTVAVHEAGLTLSLFENPTDKTSAMYTYAQATPATGLNAADVTALQKLYGARKTDVYEGASGNFSAAYAYDLTANGNVTALTADITTPGDVDYYKFTAPSVLSGVTKGSVDLKAKGLSLFTGRVTVYNAANLAVGTAVATDPTANDLSVPITGYVPGATYTVRVEGAAADVFSVGSYNLKLTYDKVVAGVVSKLTTLAPYVNYEGWANNGAQSLSQSLTAISTGNLSTFAVGGLLTSAADVDWFKFTAPAGGTLTASVWAFNGSATLPQVKLYSPDGAELTTSVVANGGGLFTVQAAGQAAGGTYYARVFAANQTTGLYVLGTNVGNAPPTLYDALSTGNATDAQKVSYSSLKVSQGRLTQFALSSFAGIGVDAAVRMTIYNSLGQKVFTLVSVSGQPLSTGSVWLEAGDYTVVYNAAARNVKVMPNVAYVVRKWERSDPIDPYPVDPTSPPPPPPPGGSVGQGPPSTSPPAGPIGPVTDPYDNT